MGLASKMAGGSAGYAANQYPGQGVPPSGGAPQGQYQAYPGGPPPQQAQPQYGAPPPQQGQGQYGAPPSQQYGASPGPGGDAYRRMLQDRINQKQVQGMFQNPQTLNDICASAPAKVADIMKRWNINMEIAQDIVQLALFDIILYVDDSGSMAFEENGERIQDLKLILQRAASAASLFDADGIEVRFMNSDLQGNNIRNETEVEQLIQRVQFKGLTPMGTSLRNKVLEPLVVQRARANQLRKPILVITITDGQPAGEANGAVFDAIKYASDEMSRTPYGKGAVSFQFAQVGNDLKARDFLAKLDNDPTVGQLVDCTSNFEVEQDEMARTAPPGTPVLTPEVWLCKLLLGAIDPSYDKQDESGNRQQSGGNTYPPPQQYGQSPQNQFGGPPPAQYGQPQGQYGAPQNQYGAQPQGQQGAYRPPPQQQQYPPQQGQAQPPYPSGGQYPGQASYNKPPPRY